MSNEAMKLALDALEASKDLVISAHRNMEFQHNRAAMACLPHLEAAEKRHIEAIAALREALAQPQQESVAWMADTGSVASAYEIQHDLVPADYFHIPLYTAL